MEEINLSEVMEVYINSDFLWEPLRFENLKDNYEIGIYPICYDNLTTYPIFNLKSGGLLSQKYHEARKAVYVVINGTERAVHKIIAHQFLSNSDGMKYVKHRDKNRRNNSKDNLYYSMMRG
jgi:hypothetical protein